MTNLDDFEKDVLYIKAFKYYGKDKFPIVKRGTLALKEKHCV
jgi:hypothetical protein